jgi:broad specificity phosphatase PhoE
MTLLQLQTTLETAALKVASAVAKKYQAEGVYAFALYTSGEYGYVIDSFATTAGLRTVAEKYLRELPYRDRWGSLEVAMRELRWSPCDSPHHGEFENEFQEANELLEEFGSGDDPDASESFEDSCRQIHEVFTTVLMAVRKSAVFDSSVVLNILMGDQSDEQRFLNAESLNSPKVLEVFGSELQCDARELARLRTDRWNG